MTETLEDVLVSRAHQTAPGFSRAVTWSFAVHVTVIAAAIAVPRTWFTQAKETPLLISVSLGGTPGPMTTGMAPLSGKSVELAPPPPVPTPARPEPARVEPAKPAPPAAKQPDLTALMNRIVTQAPKPSDSTRTAPSARPAPAATPSRGDARVDTASRTEGVGLSSGGGAGSDRVSFDPNFCCMAYAQTVVSLIDQAWAKSQTERGVATIRFEIRRDGTIVSSIIEQSSGSGLLDRVALSAVEQVKGRIPPLPPEYKENTLVFHLKFPYGG